MSQEDRSPAASSPLPGCFGVVVALISALAAPAAPASPLPSFPHVPLEQPALGTLPPITASPYRETFTTFESGQVRPLALTPDGRRLLATNTPDSRLEIFEITTGGLVPLASVPVGLEPVAVAARSDTEAWVVNHLSDSVSIVRLDGARSHVVRTLLVGDEPRDVVFAGPDRSRAFVTAAHRGQNVPFDPRLTTPGIGRADVWVFDAGNPGVPFGGAPLAILTFFADTPRALAATPDGSRVYVAGFASGNGTGTTFAQAAINRGSPPPATDAFLEPQPMPVASILKFVNGHWIDAAGVRRDDEMAFHLPDEDVFVIDATANPPRAIDAAAYRGVGTILFDLAVNPRTGRIYVSNLESHNLRRFAGPGVFAGETLRGRFAESRITVLDAAGGVSPRHLNKHVDYATCCAPIPNDENARSLAFPVQMEVSADGRTLYVAALGSSKVGIYETEALEADTFVPSLDRQIVVRGGGPTGLALDEERGRLYVLTRFDNAIAIVDLATRTETGRVALFNPEPAHVVAGRRFLYDASFSSSHGDSACASCHVFGDVDHLAWDLGDPDAPSDEDPNPYANHSDRKRFHSMKGPMVTQSLRGLDNHGPMHWRGDRTGARDAESVQPDGGAFDEHAAFLAFAGAFPDLLGRHEPIPAEDMQAFARFALELVHPPNPIRNLDNSLTPEQEAGRHAFFVPPTGFNPGNPVQTCHQCHVLDPAANAGATTKPGFFGTDGRSADTFGTAQNMKNPHLRNLYQKVGRFGMPFTPFLSPGDHAHQGDQIRGFGFIHDGSFDTLERFFMVFNFAQTPLNPEGIPLGPEGDAMRRDLEAFMLAFDSNLAPIVGQQVTIGDADPAAGARVDLLLARADEGECDVVVRGFVDGAQAGFLYVGADVFTPNRASAAPASGSALRATAQVVPGGLTFSCVPPGNGVRLGLDRDLDGRLDGDDPAPADPAVR